MKKIFLLTVLALVGCATVPVTKPIGTAAVVAIVIDGELISFIVIANNGKHIIIDTDECGDDTECVTLVKNAVENGTLDTVKFAHKAAGGI